MMKTYLKRAFQLSDSGVKGLAKSIWSFFLYYVSFVPPMICVFLFADRLLNGNTGKPVVYLLFMLAATLVMYLVINYNYKTTYDETYQESANLRIDLAEQLSKLPLSYYSKHNLSDLAQTIMADVASIEHAFANAVANSIGFAIYFLVISVALLIMNWKLGLCVLLPVLTSASVLFLTKKLQVRDVNKHYDKLRDISESFQNAIELNQEIKSYGLKEKVEAQMDQQLDESENLQWKAQITQTIPVTIGQTLSILPKKPHADDADVPQLPKPQHGFCGQIIRVNINCSHLRRIEMAAGFPAAIQWVDYSSALSSACWISCVMKSFCFR